MVKSDEQYSRLLFISFLASVTIFLLCRTAAAYIFNNNWGFTHWNHLPLWYLVGFIFFSTVLVFLFIKKTASLTLLTDNKPAIYTVSLLFFILTFLFQFDSFIYSGGNLRIRQIAQVDTIIYRFYELGTVIFVSIFYKFFSLFDISNNTAGVYSWKLLSYTGTVATFLISFFIVSKITVDKSNRFFLFILLFLGPQTILYFGFVGYETFLVFLLYLFVYVVLLFEEKKTGTHLLYLWLVALFALFMHLSMLVLLPPLFFLTLKFFVRQKSIIPFIIGVKIYIILVAAVYMLSSENFGFAKAVLFPSGKNINHTYNLFSLKHIGDLLQIFLLFVPQFIAVKILFFKYKSKLFNSIPLSALILLILSCHTAIFILEPIHSVVLDSIGYTMYLAPLGILLAFLLKDSFYGLKLFSLLAVMVPLAVLPVYTDLELSEAHINEYLEKNHQFYYEVGTAIQDSYFYNKELDRANYWYTNMDKLSRDFLDLTAAAEFASAEQYPDALRLLNQLKTKYQFWGEPRYQIASIQQILKRYALARPEIDTCLILDPFNPQYLQLNYGYYLNLGNYQKALEAVNNGLKVYPDNYDFQTDLAIILYRMKKFPEADAVAKEVIEKDSTLAYAYLIRGLIADFNKDPRAAINHMEKFVRLAPDAFETPDIRKRLNALILEQR